jgi:hypothetical protein
VTNCNNAATQPCVPGQPTSAQDLCDGLDENCDGVVNGGCICVDGHTQACYTGAPGTLGVGVCQAGVQTCAHGNWGNCLGEITPSAEVCDGLDNDCNGLVDDGLGTSTCGVGQCQVTTPNCLNGVSQTCTPRAPQAETCNGLDDDCDGVVDEDLPTLTCGVGACTNNVYSCVNGVEATCTPGTPTPEICNGIDDDCDGLVDEGNPGGGATCATGAQGVCGAGTTNCSNGTLVCDENVQPSPEICDGLDNNCNGQVDEGDPGGGGACNTGLLGVCAAGVYHCVGGHIVCVQTTQPSAEICDGLDNNCDGQVDNGLGSTTCGGSGCSVTVQNCVGGVTQTCNAATVNGQACNDGNACTDDDVCTNGVCAGSAYSCAAPDQCHQAGTCNGDGTCSFAPKSNGTSCNDGNACTQTDTCQSGVCTGSNPVVCSPIDQCHVAGVCNTGTGVCSNPTANNGTACNDSNACTQTDTCQSGVCTGSNPVVCSAAGQCYNVGVCNTSTGVCSNPAKSSGTACNDGNACTQTDTCNGSGTCVGSNPVVCSSAGQCYGVGTCNTSTGVCSNPPLGSGTACNDGNACTQTDTCNGAGTCVGSNPVVCSSAGQCYNVGTCNTSNGVCSNPAKASGTACNDGNACTQTDTCNGAGTCVGGNPVVCTASDACHVAGTCNTSNGACSNPTGNNGATCGSASNGVLECNNGACNVLACNGGYTNCSGTCVNEGADTNNCGSCGHVCPAAESCLSGTCGCPGGENYCASGGPWDCAHICGGGDVNDCNGTCCGGANGVPCAGTDCAGRCCGGVTGVGCLAVDNCGVCGGSGVDACGVCEGPGPIYSCGCYSCCPFIYSEGKDGFAYETTVGGASLNAVSTDAETGSKMQFRPMWARLDRAAVKQGKVSSKILIAEDEIAYVDEAHLTVVDAPVGYEVISESSLASNSTNPEQFYALRTAALRAPIAATWMGKQDVTKSLSAVENVAAAYDLSADNYYDLDFGAVKNAKNARLVIDGWKFQAARNLAADIEQRPARLEVQQKDGSFKTVLELAYPRGDRKAVTFDLSAVKWPAGAYRMRLWTGTGEAGTAMWWLDRVRLTEEAPVATQETEIAPSQATLSFSGTPEILTSDMNSPRESLPNGAGVLDSSMLTYGQFTRYGDVRSLLGSVDDMLVVMRTGDVVDLSFERIPAPKAGRSQSLFLRTELLFKPLKCVGCSGPTDISQNVLPLPFHGMTKYPYSGDEHYPTDAAHQRFLGEYLSREYQPGDTRWGR